MPDDLPFDMMVSLGQLWHPNEFMVGQGFKHEFELCALDDSELYALTGLHAVGGYAYATKNEPMPFMAWVGQFGEPPASAARRSRPAEEECAPPREAAPWLKAHFLKKLGTSDSLARPCSLTVGLEPAPTAVAPLDEGELREMDAATEANALSGWATSVASSWPSTTSWSRCGKAGGARTAQLMPACPWTPAGARPPRPLPST